MYSKPIQCAFVAVLVAVVVVVAVYSSDWGIVVADIVVWVLSLGISENDQHQHQHEQRRQQLSKIKCSSNKKKDVKRCLLSLFVVVAFVIRLGF